MYTPEEIRNIEFTKSLGGYRTSEVDPFIDKCADTVEALMQEKAELTKKLEVLADKLVEYRNEEDSIRTALLSAQRLGDTVVREANHKAGLILEDANINPQQYPGRGSRAGACEKGSSRFQESDAQSLSGSSGAAEASARRKRGGSRSGAAG